VRLVLVAGASLRVLARAAPSDPALRPLRARTRARDSEAALMPYSKRMLHNRARGLCVFCDEPAVVSKAGRRLSVCVEHRARATAYRQSYEEKYPTFTPAEAMALRVFANQLRDCLGLDSLYHTIDKERHEPEVKRFYRVYEEGIYSDA
jgi:hypothetical protein